LTWYVYALIDQRDAKPFYIGKGRGNRVNHHELDAKRGCGHPKSERIRDIWQAGADYERRVCKEFPLEADALRYEKRLIFRIGLHNLTNIKPGRVAPKPPQPLGPKAVVLLDKAERLMDSKEVLRKEFNRLWLVDRNGARRLGGSIVIMQDQISAAFREVQKHV